MIGAESYFVIQMIQKTLVFVRVYSVAKIELDQNKNIIKYWILKTSERNHHIRKSLSTQIWISDRCCVFFCN